MITQELILTVIFIIIPLVLIICKLSRKYHISNNTTEEWTEILVLKDTMSSEWTDRKGKKFNNIKNIEGLDNAPRVYIRKIDTLVFGQITNTKYKICKQYEDDGCGGWDY